MGRLSEFFSRKIMRLFAIFAAFLNVSDALCAYGVDLNCKRRCINEFNACRRTHQDTYANCREYKMGCIRDDCQCFKQHREYINIKHPVRQWSPSEQQQLRFSHTAADCITWSF